MVGCVDWVKGVSADVDDMYEKKQFNAPGPQFLFFMTTMYLGIRGFMDYSAYYASVVLVQAAGIGTREGAQITSTMRLPWSLKCIWAMLSDCVPIFYYKKRWYMLAATMAGSFALFQLGVLPYSVLAGPEKMGTYLLVLLLLVNIMGSLDDCLTQGQYTKVIKFKGSSILVFRSSCMTIAGTCVALYSGVLNDAGKYGPQWLMLTALPWAIMACIPIGANMMADEKEEAICRPDTGLFKRQWKVFLLAIAMGVTVLVNVLFVLIDDLKPYRYSRMFVTNTLMMGVLALSYVTIDRRIAHINVYLYLCRLCTFGLSYPLQQFYTTDPSTNCPKGEEDLNLPNFTFVIYSTFGSLAASLATFLGLYLFENYLVHWNARPAFWVTTAFQVFAGMFDILNTTRMNQYLLSWTGLGNVLIDVRVNLFDGADGYRKVRADDMCTFLFGSAFLEPLIDQLDSLPSTLLLSKLCPKGIETTMFAILAGFSNIGMSLSGQIGGAVVSYFGFAFRRGNRDSLDPDEWPVCDMGSPGDTNDPNTFHGLAKTLVLGNLLLPFITIPLTWCFIPDIRLDEDFLDEEEDPREVELQAGASIDVATGAATSGGRNSRGSIDIATFRAARSNVSGSGLLM